MADNVLCHMLIGPAGSGKSTLARQMQQRLPQTQIVSTDLIRHELYGDAAHQGHWAEIEAVVISQIQRALQQNQSVIYDATNAQRLWRMGLLEKLKPDAPRWVGWQLKTPLKTCHQWNQQRDRQVPASVIESQHAALQQFPPLTAEGFLAILPLPAPAAIDQVETGLNRLSRSFQNRLNRTQHEQITFHRYSNLLDFDRLMHLLSLLVQYPGLGELHKTAPETLQALIGQAMSAIRSPLDEVAAVIKSQKGVIYANPTALGQDLRWLEVNGFLSATPTHAPLTFPEPAPTAVNPHPYADWETWQRLLLTIRFISHHPFCWEGEHQSSLTSLVAEMQWQGVLVGDRQAAIRKDIEQVLKPFGILPPFRMRRGYFLGTGLLSEPELLQIASLLQGQAKNTQDPLALYLLESLQQRLRRSQHALDDLYPVRAIANRLIINPDLLPVGALARQPETLAREIETGQLLELKRFSGVGRFDNAPDTFFCAWPLQIVFRNIAWYLGYELADGPQKGLLQFERLDRLFRGREQSQQRSLNVQRRALRRLQTLQLAGGGLYLGRDVQQQQQFLSNDPNQQAAASIQAELWCTDQIFAFISEGTQRFPTAQMKMSPKPRGGSSPQADLFSLPQSPDGQYPNRLQLTLPIWSSEDIDLRRWILGFGAAVKVVAPPELQQQLYDMGQQIVDLYRDDGAS